MKNKNKSTDRGKVKEIVEDEETKRLKENIYVVFVECESPGNVGFLARTMGNFGLHKMKHIIKLCMQGKQLKMH